MINFDITYLKLGNKKQQKVYRILVSHRIMEQLSAYTPIFVGTIPIRIDIETSDIDIHKQRSLLQQQPQPLLITK
ncbi:MAG: DUF4269 domain-containing protein [Arcticibacter sp.]